MSDETTRDPLKAIFDVNIEMKINDSHFIYIQTADGSKKTLDYDYKKCNGCGICISVCPVGAIEAGPLLEIATGMDAPPVIIDQTKCTFCGMCASFCPVKAIKMDIDGEDILKKTEYIQLDSNVVINEKCLPCMLCEKVCPQEAIELTLTIPKKEEIAPLKENQDGEITVDMNKCNFCGICAHFCSAFILVERDPTANNPVPFADLLIDLDKCDYCKICEDLCPENAITVKGILQAQVPEINGTLNIDNNKCVKCGWCREVCPYDAVEVIKPFEGDIELIEKRLTECDPIGCHGCFNVCPAHAWFIPGDKKIDVAKDLCIYCGACEKACHVYAIDVGRTDVKHTQITNKPWTSQWEDAVISIKTDNRVRPDINRRVEVDTTCIRHRELKEISSREDNDHMPEIRSRIDELILVLGDIKSRYKMEEQNPR
jgi:4Fe-4S ferredoxin